MNELRPSTVVTGGRDGRVVVVAVVPRGRGGFVAVDDEEGPAVPRVAPCDVEAASLPHDAVSNAPVSTAVNTLPPIRMGGSVTARFATASSGSSSGRPGA